VRKLSLILIFMMTVVLAQAQFISNVTVTGTPTTLTVSWTTPTPTSSFVKWGTTATYGHRVPGTGATPLGTSGSVTINKLVQQTQYHIRIVSADSLGEVVNSVDYIATTPGPDFSIAAAPNSMTVTQGQSNTSTITVASQWGFNSATTLSAPSLPAGVKVSFAPASITPPSGGSATAVMTVSVDGTAVQGTSSFNVLGISGSLSRSASLSLTVIAPMHDVSLTWNADAPTQNVVSYNMYRSLKSGSGYQQIASAISCGGSSCAYDDKAVLAGTLYCYVATAVDDQSRESGYSNESCKQVPTP
jgi:hypothetical protein